MGHLFVARGDLTKLACDGLLIPCDANLNITDVWIDVLPRGLARARYHPEWLVLEGHPNEAGLVELPHADGRYVSAFVAVEQAAENSPECVVDRTWLALTEVARKLQGHGQRSLPLIGIPLVGTGHGGLETRRAEVIELLLDRARTTPLAADIALILYDRRDMAAVQERRREADWANLTDDLRAHADRLGRLAAQGELSLFLGAGVSKPVGPPDWWQLLDALAAAAGCEPPDRNANPFEAAFPIVAALGDRYHDAIRQELSSRLHGVGHALLASIGAKRMVTTNFDSCMEMALVVPTGDEFSVLTRQSARGGAPWLLKLNGDTEAPTSIVLTDGDLSRHPEERRALEGVVQTLLLTSHLFFVGFSLTDDKFLQLADAVSKVRARATGRTSSKPGTALALTAADQARARYTDLDLLVMDPQSPRGGARLLEIFLDRMAWAASTQGDLASEYVLDDRYESGLRSDDLWLRAAVLQLARDAGAEARRSPGWRRVADCLRSLGADESLL